jgi:hypothetical protein
MEAQLIGKKKRKSTSSAISDSTVNNEYANIALPCKEQLKNRAITIEEHIELVWFNISIISIILLFHFTFSWTHFEAGWKLIIKVT